MRRGGMRLLVGHEEFYPIREAHVGEHADGEVIRDCFQAEVRLVASTLATLPTARLPRGQRWHTLVAVAGIEHCLDAAQTRPSTVNSSNRTVGPISPREMTSS
jgi:hypothetical protein